MTAKRTFYCSFCRKSQHDVKLVFATYDDSVTICDECVGLCVDIMKERAAAKALELSLQGSSA